MKDTLLQIVDTRVKKIIAGVGVIIIFIGCGMGIYVLNQTPDPYLKLTEAKVEVEYGKNISTEVKDYLDTTDLTKDNKTAVLQKANVKVEAENELEKNYPGIGTYKVTISYQKEVVTKEVVVRDTIAPAFVECKEEIKIQKDAEEVALEKYYQAKDTINEEQVDSTIAVTSDAFDIGVVDNYPVTVVATDINGNTTEKECLVIVIESENEEELTTMLDGTIPLSLAYKEKKIATELAATQKELEEKTKTTNTKPSSNTSSTTNQGFVVELNVPFIDQYAAGAPMGCEGASLLQALQGKGYATNVGLNYFLDNMPYTMDGNPHHGFVTSPYYALPDSDMVYQSIFPSALTPYGSRYGTCVNTSGYSTAQLVEELKAGNPSVVYVTYKFAYPKWDPYSFGNCVTNLHVMTLIGYNSNTGQYKVMDPAGGGSYWVKGSSFENAYNALKYAITVK